jgi:hypothetical protein
MANIPLHEPDGDLVPLLRSASQDDLGILVQYIMKAATSELELYPDFKLENPRANDDPPVFGGNHALYVDDIPPRFRNLGGTPSSTYSEVAKEFPMQKWLVTSQISLISCYAYRPRVLKAILTTIS